MSSDPTKSVAYTDFAALTALKKSAAASDPKAVREAARQFEGLFTRMMLKSMRSAGIGDSLTSSKETDFYRDMYDDQLSTELTKGKGIGLADMLVRQLQKTGIARPEAGVQGLEVKGATSRSVVQAPLTSSPSIDTKVSSDSSSSLQSPVASPSSSPADFVAKMWPYAQQAGQQLGVDPRTLIAHAALETGWGRKIPASSDGTSSNNLFGIKANGQWTGSAVGARTVEYEDGVAVSKVQRFRSYASPAHSFADYAAMLGTSARYAAVRGTGANPASFANALQQGGYATDPAYAKKLIAVADQVGDLANVNSLKQASNLPIATGERGSDEGVVG